MLVLKMELIDDQQPRLQLHTSNNVGDKFEETLSQTGMVWAGGTFEKSINWEYLLDVLQVLKGETVTIRMGEDRGVDITKYRIDEGLFNSLINPLRIKKDSLGRSEKLKPSVAKHVDAKEAASIVGTTPV